MMIPEVLGGKKLIRTEIVEGDVPWIIVKDGGMGDDN